jgi:hypothetical protein
MVNGEALNLAADPPTYRNIPLQKLNAGYYWFLRGTATLSLLFFLGTVLVLPVRGTVVLFRRKRTTRQAREDWSRQLLPGWMTGLLVWLAALLGTLLLLGTALLAVMIRGGMLPDPRIIWLQVPALMYGHLPSFQSTMPWYVQMLVLLPSVIFIMAVVAGVGMRQVWRVRCWSLAGRVLLTVVIVLLLVMTVLIA